MRRLIAGLAFMLGSLTLALPASATPPPALPSPSRSFDSGSLHVDVYGTAGKPALVFLPGLTCGPWEWSGEIARFSRDNTIYAVTLPGQDGRAPVASDTLFQTAASDFWTMLQTNHIDKPVVVGHSLGGTLAWLLAEQHSDRLAGIVAVDGLPVFPGFDKMSDAQRRQAAQQFAGMIASASTPQQFQAAEEMYVLPYMITSKTDVAAVAPLVARSDPKATAAWMSQDVLLDTRPELRAISVPALEITSYDPAVDSRIVPSQQAKQAYYASLLQNDPTAKVEIVPNSRHFIMLDQPAALDADLSAFFGSLQRPG